MWRSECLQCFCRTEISTRRLARKLYKEAVGISQVCFHQSSSILGQSGSFAAKIIANPLSRFQRHGYLSSSRCRDVDLPPLTLTLQPHTRVVHTIYITHPHPRASCFKSPPPCHWHGKSPPPHRLPLSTTRHGSEKDTGDERRGWDQVTLSGCRRAMSVNCNWECLLPVVLPFITQRKPPLFVVLSNWGNLVNNPITPVQRRRRDQRWSRRRRRLRVRRDGRRIWRRRASTSDDRWQRQLICHCRLWMCPLAAHVPSI